MGITETAIIYGIIGVVTAAAMWLSGAGAPGVQRAGLFAVHALLWPFFAPVLLGGAAERAAPTPRTRRAGAEATELDGRVHAAEERLLAALASLDGLAEDALRPELHRVRELTGALARMARRLAEMDELLATPEFDEERALGALEALEDTDAGAPDARADSVRARLRNIRRLVQMRQNLSMDFERAMVKVDEISSQIRLLRFADRPEHEVGELIWDIEATVEGLSEGMLSG